VGAGRRLPELHDDLNILVGRAAESGPSDYLRTCMNAMFAPTRNNSTLRRFPRAAL
jgi:hypothetical protein